MFHLTPSPKRKKLDALWCLLSLLIDSVKLLGISKTFVHHFWLRLMAGAEFWGHSVIEHAKSRVTNVF
jgi:hypothetical protein